MRESNRIKKMFESKLGQELPGWSYIVMLILGLFALGLLIYIAVKSGQATVKQVTGLR